MTLGPRARLFATDATTYRTAGIDLFTTGRIQSDIVMPLYPIWTFITGGDLGLQLADIVLSALTVGVIGSLSFAMFRSRRAAIAAGAITCIYPFFLFYAPAGITETMFIFLLCSSFLALYRGDFVLGSILIVLSILTRPIIDPVAPLIIVTFSLLVHGSSRSLCVRRVAVYLVLYTVLMAPWWVHNYHKYGSFVRLDLGDGHALVQGSICPLMDPGIQRYARTQPECIDFDTIADPQVRTNAMRAAVLHFARRAPLEFAKLSVLKLVGFWRPWLYTQNFAKRIAGLLSYGLVFLMSIAFFARNWRRYGALLSPVLILAVYLSLVHSIGYGYIRYRLPLEPFLIVIAGFGLDRSLRFSARRTHFALKRASFI